MPLRTLHELLDDLTGDVVSVVHVLPFYPASSDGGFAITDHQAVDPRLGSWADISDLSRTLHRHGRPRREPCQRRPSVDGAVLPGGGTGQSLPAQRRARGRPLQRGATPHDAAAARSRDARRPAAAVVYVQPRPDRRQLRRAGSPAGTAAHGRLPPRCGRALVPPRCDRLPLEGTGHIVPEPPADPRDREAAADAAGRALSRLGHHHRDQRAPRPERGLLGRRRRGSSRLQLQPPAASGPHDDLRLGGRDAAVAGATRTAAAREPRSSTSSPATTASGCDRWKAC